MDHDIWAATRHFEMFHDYMRMVEAHARKAALEEAAKVADRFPFEGWDSTHEFYTEPNPAAEAIRALVSELPQSSG